QYSSPTLARYPAFFALVALSLLACLPLARLREALMDPRRPMLAQGLGLLFFLGMALRSNRFIFDFVVFALPFCAGLLGSRLPAAGRTRACWDSRWPYAASLALALAVALLVRPALPAHALARSVPQ